MLAKVDISGGQVSGVDDLAPVSSSVINWEIDEAGINRPRPALSSYSVTNLSVEANGLCRYGSNTVITTTDRKAWAVSDTTTDTALALSTSSTGTQIEGAKRSVFAVGNDHIYIAGGGRLQRWSSTSAVTEVVSSSPPCTHVAAIGARLVVNDIATPGNIAWSDIGEGAWTTWPSDNYLGIDARPDGVVGVYENVNELFVFGDTSLQVFGLGADPTLPFESISTIDTGLAAPYCVVRLDSSFAFLDDKRRIVISDGRSVEPISTAIQDDLRSLTTLSDAFAYREEIGQRSQLVFCFPTETRTFVYDLAAKHWTERKRYTAPFQGYFGATAYVYRSSDNSHIVGTTTGVAKLVTNSRQDLGGALVCERVTGLTNYGIDGRKRSRRMQFVFRRGTAAQGATPGALEARVKDDDKPWTTWQQISVGVPSDYGLVKWLYFGGVFYYRRVEIRYSNTEDMSLISVHDDVTPLEMQAVA